MAMFFFMGLYAFYGQLRRGIRHFPKPGFQGGLAKLKNIPELSFYKKGMGQRTEDAQGKRVVHNVVHPYAAFHRFYPVFMMPKPVGAKTLFIHKEFAFLYMGNFRNPPGGKSRKGLHPVMDYLPRIHGAGAIGPNVEMHMGRGNGLQIGRVR